MRDACHWARHAGGVILTEYGLHFAKEDDHWRCVEYPDLLMLRGERYRARFAFFKRLPAVAQEVAGQAEHGQ